MAREHPVAHGGTTLHRLALSGSTVAEVAYPPGLRVPVHTHAHAHVGFLLAGSCRETVGARAYDYETAQLIVKSSGECHSNEAGAGGTRFLILDLEDASTPPGILGERVLLREAVFVPIVQRLLRELRTPDEVTALSCEGLVMELFAEIVRAKKRRAHTGSPGWVSRAGELLRDRARESLSLRDIAAELGLHPTHFSRAFRRHFGVTPGAYVRSVRLAHARALLTQSDRPLREIALEAGFSDQSHLTRSLRRETGTTPAEYRRRSRR